MVSQPLTLLPQWKIDWDVLVHYEGAGVYQEAVTTSNAPATTNGGVSLSWGYFGLDQQ